MRMLIVTGAALFLSALGAWPAEVELATPIGRWKTIDDKTGNPKAIVQIYYENGQLFGRIETTLNPNAKKICEKCKDERQGKPIVGMVIMRKLTMHGGEYGGGDILDPDNGSVYRCKLRVEDQGKKLSVRGYIGFSLLGRSQTWFREP